MRSRECVLWAATIAGVAPALSGCSGSGGAAVLGDAGGGGPDGGAGALSDGAPVASSGVCGFSQPVTYGAAGPDGLVDVPANDPNIHYEGRIDCSKPLSPKFAFPGVSIRAHFQGDSIAIKLTDFGNGSPTKTNYYDVIVDHGAPTTLQASASQSVYPLASGLGPGDHEVEVVKRNEAMVGSGIFQGFRIRAGTKLLPTVARPHRLEFIGDSITCGYGDMLSVSDPSMSHFTSANENETLAWGAVSARALNAELMVVAYSGKGVYRNYEDGVGPTIPELYLKSLPNNSSAAAWNPAVAVPDVVVINLGTNDFSLVVNPSVDGGVGMVDDAAFISAYDAFLLALRGYYPKATMIVALGPMISDDYPAGYRAWTNIQADAIRVVADRNMAGDPDVHVLVIPPQSAPYGEDYHPTVAEQQSMSDQVVTMIKQIKGW